MSMTDEGGECALACSLPLKNKGSVGARWTEAVKMSEIHIVGAQPWVLKRLDARRR